jgi:hypothetical protein
LEVPGKKKKTADESGTGAGGKKPKKGGRKAPPASAFELYAEEHSHELVGLSPDAQCVPPLLSWSGRSFPTVSNRSNTRKSWQATFNGDAKLKKVLSLCRVCARACRLLTVSLLVLRVASNSSRS